MILERLVCTMMATNCYLFGDDKTKEIAIIDPGGEPTAITRRIERKGYDPKMVILTHGHPDHTGSAKYMHLQYGIPVLFNEKDKSMIKLNKGEYIKENDIIELGDEKLEVLESPGHTPGGILLISYKNKVIFTGDTLFMGSIGRTDIGGNYNKLMDSIRTKIMRNPQVSDEFKVYPGHGEDSNVGYERKQNMFSSEFS